MIALPSPGAVGGRQDGFNLLTAEKADQPLHLPLERDAEDARDRRRQFGAQPVAQIMDKGTNGRQPRVARPDGVAALLLQVIEEAQHGVGLQDLQRPRAAATSAALLKITKQQSKGVAV